LQTRHRQAGFHHPEEYKADVGTQEQKGQVGTTAIKYNLLENKVTCHIHQSLIITARRRKGDPDAWK